jgi:CubicO group peptidase (beta-lactamase class C family)
VRRKIAISLVAVLAALAAPAAAQQDRPAYRRALAAGYVASFTCSNQFNGGMDPDRTRADDLRGTYPELQPLLAELAPEVDRTRRIVSVTYDPAMPPRIAVWRLYLGCALLPIGASSDAVALPAMSDRTSFGAADSRPWPMGDQRATGRFRGNRAALERIVADAFDRRTYGQGSETTALLVLQDGRIVAERYRPDFDMHSSQRTWSVAKSIAGTIFGIAVQQGLVRLDEPAHVPEWQTPGDPRAAITYDQLLRMSSGLHSDWAGNRTDDLYFGGVAVTDQIGAWPLVAPPGAAFRYANNDILAAMRGLRQRLGSEALNYPYRSLFFRIGMTRTVAETDWRGNFILSSQVWTTARDLARLGMLHVQDGMWEGERILPEDWNEVITRRGPAQPARGDGYGLAWWTLPPELGLPPDAFAAQGNRGQYLTIIPSRRLVVVRRGYDGVGQGFNNNAFVRDIVGTLP